VKQGIYGLKCIERVYGIDNDGLELAIYEPEIGVRDELVKKGT